MGMGMGTIPIPIPNTQLFDCSTEVEGSHDCTHGDDPITDTHHAIFCKY